jgi:pyridoxamine 5'-phosphate oxidase
MSRIIISAFYKHLKNLTFHFLNNAFAIVLFAIMSKENLPMFNASEEHSLNPFEMFSAWFEEAKNTKEIHDATAMSLSTASGSGRPSVRIVLLKKFNEQGFTFFTNSNSQKGKNLQKNPQAEINFYWAPLGRQIRIYGKVSEVSAAESDEYFASRHIISQMGACVSKQSSELESYQTLQNEFQSFQENHNPESNIIRPSHWKGYRITPQEFEFWIDGAYRLHLRHKYII